MSGLNSGRSIGIRGISTRLSQPALLVHVICRKKIIKLLMKLFLTFIGNVSWNYNLS